MTQGVFELEPGIYSLGDESTNQQSDVIDMAVHPFFKEFDLGYSIEPHTTKTTNRLSNSEHPIFTSVPECDWSRTIDKLSSIGRKASTPLILFKTDSWGHSPIEHGRSFSTVANYMRRVFRPKKIQIYGQSLWDEKGPIGPQGCVGHTYKDLSKLLSETTLVFLKDLIM